jgi:hypothetical protein
VHRTVVFALLAGCRLNFFELDDSVDAPPSELGPWSEPTRVVELSSSDSDDDPSLTADQLEIYFDSGRFTTGGAGGDVWVATRTSTSEPFGPPVVIDPFVSGFDDTTGDLSPDGLRIYVASNRVSTADRDVFVSSRANRQSPWSPLSIISELTSPAQDSGVCESADGLTLLFASERTGSGDFYIVTRATPTSPWSVPELVAGINTNGEESQQWCNADLTLVYFTHIVNGQRDIWYASRANPTLPFDAPRPVTELNTDTLDDTDPWVSPDLRTIYFARDVGMGDIFMSTR